VLLLFPTLLNAASASLNKVLPHFVDREGRHTLSPSLYERDAYQAELRRKPEMRSGLRFDVQWKGSRNVPLTLRVELRGNRAGAETTADIYKPVTRRGWWSKWSALELTGEDYKSFGEMVAWRTTLWAGDQLLDEQHSFLW
jgi:hypothetical protein